MEWDVNLCLAFWARLLGVSVRVVLLNVGRRVFEWCLLDCDVCRMVDDDGLGPVGVGELVWFYFGFTADAFVVGQ